MKPLQIIRSINGSLFDGEAMLLFELAAQAREGCIVEIGSFHGRSTTALALGSQSGHGAAVYAVDPHEIFSGLLGGRFTPEDRVTFFENMLRTGCAATVRLINLPSTTVCKAWDQPIDLLWIDGDHSYEVVNSDFWDWVPHLTPGGRVALHDALDPELGVGQVIREAVATGEFVEDTRVDLTVVLRRS